MKAGTFAARREMETCDPSPQHRPIASAALRAVRHSGIGSHSRRSNRLELQTGRLADSRARSSPCLAWFQGGAERWLVGSRPARLPPGDLPEQRTSTEETRPQSRAGLRLSAPCLSQSGVGAQSKLVTEAGVPGGSLSKFLAGRSLAEQHRLKLQLAVGRAWPPDRRKDGR